MSNIAEKEYIERITKNRNDIQNAAIKMQEMIGLGELKEQDCPVTHRFLPGLYIREIFMPKGTRIIGKIHATEHINIVLTGCCTVFTAEIGKEEMVAPYSFISKAGVQKALVVHEDCYWQTLHVTDKTDIDEIEKEVIAEGYDQLLIDGLLKNKELQS